MSNQVKSTTSFNQSGETAMTKIAQKSGKANPYEQKQNYYDPMGYKSRDGQPVNLRAEIKEQNNWDEKFEEINDALAQKSAGVSVKDAIKAVFDVPRVSLPVWTQDDLFISDRQDLPMVDALARIAISVDEVRLDEVSEVAEVQTASDEVDNVDVQNDTIENYKYNVSQIYIQKQISDKLVATNRYDPERTKTQLGSEAIDRYKEKQSLLGTANDANGFEGLLDWVDASRTFDATDDTVDTQMFRQVVTELNKRGVGNGNQMLVTDHDTYAELKTALDDFQRFQQPQSEFSFGMVAIEVDGVLVAQSHGLENDRSIVNFDASAHAWYTLQEKSVKTRISQEFDTADDLFVYEMTTLGSEAKSNIAVVENIGETSA